MFFALLLAVGCGWHMVAPYGQTARCISQRRKPFERDSDENSCTAAAAAAAAAAVFQATSHGFSSPEHTKDPS